MKIMVCPECKEVLGEEELRGSNPCCYACSVRKNRNDLVEVDTEREVESQIQGSAFDQRGQRPGYDSFETQRRKGRSFSPEQWQAGIPVIHSLNELQLGKKMFWEHNAEDFGSSQTLVIKCGGMVSSLFFAIFWLGFCAIPIALFIHESINHESVDSLPVLIIFFLFGGIGVGLLYSSIMACFSKTWVEIDNDNLYIERGLYRSGKKKIIRRSTQTEVSMYSNSSINGHAIYNVRLMDDTVVKVASGVDYNRASEIVTLFKTLLWAEL